MNNSKGLMYPALHKLYSALSSLEKFEKGTNFFDNIMYLDNFFSEYRNITFVLQKSLAHTEFNNVYQELRNKYLVNDVCKWFIDKRNEVLKEQPFDLEKKIAITIYSQKDSLTLPEQIFTIENDVEYSTIIDSLKSVFLTISSVEVMFSAEFSFYERGKSDELYENFVSGINYMRMFINAMKQAINEQCELSDQLEKRIKDLNFYRVPKNMLFIDDYIYYSQEDKFEKGSRVELLVQPAGERMPIANIFRYFPENVPSDEFDNFVLMHVIIYQMQRKLMPTCLIVYNDDTCRFMSFDSSIRTTIYRKLNEIAKQIKADGIKKVLYVTEMLQYPITMKNDTAFQNMNSKNRTQHANSEVLAFFMLGQDLSNKSYYFEIEKIDDMKYIISILSKRDTLPANMRLFNPVITEFVRLSSMVKNDI